MTGKRNWVKVSVVVAVGLLASVATTSRAFVDCNENGVDDPVDIAQGTSADCNTNAVPDECDVEIAFAEETIGVFTKPPVSASPVDFDGDGDLDVLVLTYTWTEPGADDRVIAWHENTDGTGTFGPAQIISNQIGGAYRASSADLDGDGDADPVFLEFEGDSGNSLVWRANLDGDGSFGAKRIIATELVFSRFVGTADLDGDGDVDVLGSTNWYENVDGFGNFGPPQAIPGGSGDTATIAVSDLDGDGDLDLVHGLWDIGWNENLDGLGNFGPRNLITTTGSSGGLGPAVSPGDVDGDGDPDLIVATGGGDSLVWLENVDGQGTFDFETTIGSYTETVSDVHTVDIDGDGDLDVAFVVWDDTVRWFENLDGLGTFGNESIVSAFTDLPPTVVVADFTSDGRQDLLVPAYQDGVVFLYRNTGLDCDANEIPDACDLATGAVDDCNSNSIPDGCEIGVASAPDCNANANPDACDIDEGSSTDCGNGIPDECPPDCNGNGVGDDCDVSAGTSVDCNLNWIPDECEPDCNSNLVADECDITSGTSLDCNPNLVPDECESDCNGNQVPDQCDITSGTSGDCNVNMLPDECEDCNGNGMADECDINWPGDSEDCNSNDVPDECDLVEETSHDCNADTIPDECQTDCNANGLHDTCDLDTGTSADCDLNAIPDECDVAVAFDSNLFPEGPNIAVAADVNRDGKMDIVGFERTDGLFWSEGNGHGFFGGAQVVEYYSGSSKALVVTDLDGDLDVDIVLATADNGWPPLADRIDWFENLDGAGTFGPRNELEIVTLPESLIATDVNGDGDPDLVVALYGNNELVWYQNLSGNGFSGRNVIHSGGRPSAVAAEDLDLDGDEDLLMGLSDAGQIVWIENLGGGQFGPPSVVSSDAAGAISVFCADLDGDGDPDALSASTDDGKFVWHENMDGAGSFAAENVITSGVQSVRRIGAADLNGDGHPDVLTATGNQTAWHENDGAGNLSTAREISHSSTHVGAEDLNGDLRLDVIADGRWYENLSEDCNGNLLPDACEDCDGTDIADDCEIAAGISIDCDDNGVPDTCDTPCTSACDVDGDQCLDDVDTDPFNANACGDSDGDGCDDCWIGWYYPGLDGQDADGDGICNVGDCAPDDAFTWFEPAAIDTLMATHASNLTSLSWQDPDERGSVLLRFDTLRSIASPDFDAASCLETDETDRSATDGEPQSAGQLFFYLIRVENDCPGPGSMGAASDGTPRSAAACP